MSEPVDGSGPMRRTPRVSDGGAPVSGALAIVLAVIAVVAGFLILRSISDGGENELDAAPIEGPAGDADTPADDTTGDVTASTAPPTLAPTTTTAPFITQGATVIVANANSQGGSAGAMTRALEAGPGFTMVDPVNANASVGDIANSVIYYDLSNAAAEGVARSLAVALGGVADVIPLPSEPLTSDGEMNGADVLLMLGNDKANKTLAELNPDTVNSASVITNPDVAVEGTTTTTG